MAQPQRAASKESKSTGEVVSELWGLLKDYGKQETIDPLKTLGRFVAWGSAASVCFAIAGTLFAVAILRVLQIEGRRWLGGNWSPVAYVLALIVVSLVAYLSIKQIKKRKSDSTAIDTKVQPKVTSPK